MDLQEILQKPSLEEQDLKILYENIHSLSHKDLVRLGLAQEETEETIEEKPKKINRKLDKPTE